MIEISLGEVLFVTALAFVVAVFFVWWVKKGK